METVDDFIQLARIMRCELRRQVSAVKGLELAFDGIHQQIIRHDQVADLRILRSITMGEVENIRPMESAAQIGATKGAFWGGVAAFTIGSLFAAAKGRQDAYTIGVQIASSVPSREVPFGTVLITIDGQGIPKGVKVASISQLARESNMSEAEVEASLNHNGYLLMNPEEFAELLDKVEPVILNGSVCLPLARSELMKLLTR